MLNPANLLWVAAPAVPVGSVMAYAGKVDNQPGELMLNRAGWLVCDGRKLDVAQYPELFAALGHLYDPGPPPGSDEMQTFYLPDLQGQFLRGTTSSTDLDPDLSERTLANGDKNQGVGSFQDYALQEHVHTYQAAVTANSDPSGKTVAAVASSQEKTTNPEASPDTPKPDDFKMSKYETRPRNVAVYYIIKYTNRLPPQAGLPLRPPIPGGAPR